MTLGLEALSNEIFGRTITILELNLPGVRFIHDQKFLNTHTRRSHSVSISVKCGFLLSIEKSDNLPIVISSNEVELSLYWSSTYLGSDLSMIKYVIMFGIHDIVFGNLKEPSHTLSVKVKANKSGGIDRRHGK
ncbi:hypothetical protein STEG23_030250, partial [Scotinomys teguina]